VDILWSIFLITLLIITIIVVAVLIPTLRQLSKTLEVLEKISLQWHKDFEPAIKDLADITVKANNSIKKIETGIQIFTKLNSLVANSYDLLKILSSKLIKSFKKESVCLEAGIKKGLEVWEQGNKKIKGTKEFSQVTGKEK